MQKSTISVPSPVQSGGAPLAAPGDAGSQGAEALQQEHAMQALALLPQDIHASRVADSPGRLLPALVYASESESPVSSSGSDESLESNLAEFEKNLSSAVHGHALDMSSGRASLVAATLALLGKSDKFTEHGIKDMEDPSAKLLQSKKSPAEQSKSPDNLKTAKEALI